MSKTLLVTGGAGYVGSHCCKAFAAAGWKLVIYDNLSRGWADLVKWGELIEGDILDRDALSAAMVRVKPDAVAHFAALAYVAESFDMPGDYLRTNVSGTLNLVEAMHGAGVGKILFSSSCATYGAPDRLPIDEQTAQAPINPYGWSKLMAEQVLAAYGDLGMRSAILRYFNAAGDDEDLETGERHEPETHLIPLAIMAAQSGGTFTVNGDDFPTPDGTAVRDYVHVADLADAHCRALDYLRAGGASDVFNLGTGSGMSVAEILAAIEGISGAKIDRRMAGRRAGDPPSLVASADKARRVLGWEPTNSSIDQIISSAWRWHSRNSD